MGAFDTTFNVVGEFDAFATKLNPSGSALVYSTFLGGSGDDFGRDIALDTSGSAYIGGFTSSMNFPTTVGAFDTTHNGTVDAFVTKLNPTGSAPLVYSTFLGGIGNEEISGIEVDTSGNAYVTGGTESPNFPTTVGAFDTTFNGVFDIFVTKLNPTGSEPLVYSTFLGGNERDFLPDIAVDASGNAYIAGITRSPDFPTTAGAFDTTFNGGSEVFFTKLNPAGSAPLVYSTFLGSSSQIFRSGMPWTSPAMLT